ncbi:MAG: DUF6179 domain-containing protein [Lachnospiraceae bacterium]|nr:DUF6179 domain-containing protein [Lachnospiraceae bacterium]
MITGYQTDYQMEELVPVAAGLAERYTGGESTSITYEKAQQLMEAVLYCIHELEQSGQNPVSGGKLPPQQAYRLGLDCVKKKTEETLSQYHAILQDFMYFENRCLYDTLVKGFPRFFRRYHIEFNPQDTILTLDYPVLRDLSYCTGIDKIAAFTECIRLEQRFLKLFPEDEVRKILQSYNRSYAAMVENICEPVVGTVICRILAGKSPSGEDGENSREQTVGWLQQNFKQFLMERCGDSKDAVELYAYFADSVRGIAARLKLFAGKT